MKEKEFVNVVNDQYGCPTYAADLANAIMQMIQALANNDTKNKIAGIYNYSNSGAISWYDFAAAIKALIHSNCPVNPIPTSGYPTPATRPQYSVLDTAKIKSTFNITIPAWKDSLQKCIALLQ